MGMLVDTTDAFVEGHRTLEISTDKREEGLARLLVRMPYKQAEMYISIDVFTLKKASYIERGST